MRPIALSLALCFAFAAGAQTVSVGSASGQCGGEVSVPVAIDSVSGMLSLEFRIDYDPALVTPAAVTAGSLTGGFALASNASGGELHVAMASGTPVSGSGSIAEVTFAAAATASGNVPLTISHVLINDVPSGGSSGSLDLDCLQPPPAPLLVSPANGANDVEGPVTLDWSAADDATSYTVYFGASSPPPPFTTTAATSTSVPTETGTTYFWSVVASNAAGSTPSATFSFTTAGTACVTPAAPQLRAPSSVTSGDPFELTWRAVAGATEYVVEESERSSLLPATSTTVSSTALTLTRTAANDTTLYFRVYARNTLEGCAVDGPYSATAAVRVLARPALAVETRVVPVVASAEGNLGSFFRTSMQLHNAISARISGRLVFHAAGATGTSSDPSMAYVLEAGETKSYDDVVTAIGVPRGVGSLDLVTDPGSSAPLAVVRVYNDAGAAGTSGTTLDTLALGDALAAGQRGILLAPMAPARARMNIGIRTLTDGVTMTVSVRDKRGATIHSSRVSYPPTYFVQLPLADFTGNAVLAGDEVIVIEVESGSAMVYGSTTDNVTQDPSVQIARRSPV